MKPILALDLSTAAVGWACGPADNVPRSGIHRLGSFGPNIGGLLGKFDRFLDDLMALENPGLVAFEAPLGSFAHGGKTNQDTVRQLFALASHTEFVCERRGIPRFEGNVSTVKKCLSGNGHAQKPEMVAAARARGFINVNNHDEADACGLWLFTIQMIDKRERTNYAARFDRMAVAASKREASFL